MNNLRKKRNKKLLNGKVPIEKGCEVEYTPITGDEELPFGDSSTKTYKITDIEEFIHETVDGTVVIDSEDLVHFTPSMTVTISDIHKDEYKILGKPVTLEEVLRMLNLQESPFVDYMTISGLLMKGDKVILELDLTKAPEDQSQEVQDKIIKLIG